MVMRASPVPTFQIITRLSLPGVTRKDLNVFTHFYIRQKTWKTTMCVCPTRSEKYVACSGVPGDDAHSFGVTLQHHHGVGEGAGQRVIWDLPHLERRDEEKSDSVSITCTFCPL